MRFGKLGPALFLCVARAFCQEPSLLVQGVDGGSATLHLSDLDKLPKQTFKTTDHGAPAVFIGVSVRDILAKVESPVGPKFHGTAASYYLLVEAKDGYRAVFAWSELDPTVMDKPVYVVTERDGKPLSEKDGPLQLVAPGEKRGARSVRQVIALRIKQAN